MQLIFLRSIFLPNLSWNWLRADMFQITAITKTNSGYASHLERLLSISPLRQLHWVNIARHHAQFITIRNEAERSNAEK
ncbi:MAG: hypothetical protein NTY15_00780 [Planctomycetota bacterium]|nr:hypothetical protein [Planctomycetota bacterium]